MSKRQSIIYFIATILAGIANYLFQVLGAQKLSIQDFGRFNSWLAQLSLFMFLGVFFQYYANLSPPSQKQERRVHRILLLASVLALLAYLLLPITAITSFSFALLAGLIFSYLFGLVQIQLGFALMGISALLVSVSKLSIVSMSNLTDMLSYCRAVPVSYFIGIPTLLVYLSLTKNRDRTLKQKDGKVGIGLWAALVLSVASVIIPQMDIWVIGQTQDIETAGKFGYLSLLYKGFFFLFMIASQWFLPQQVSANTLSNSKYRSFATLAIVYIGGLITGVLAWFAHGFIFQNFLGKSVVIEPGWFLLSFLHITSLTYMFYLIQSFCVDKKAYKFSFLIFVNVLSLVSFSLLKLDVSAYLVSVCIIEFIACVFMTHYNLKNEV